MHIPDLTAASLFDGSTGFTVRPEGLQATRQYYLPDTNVLVTEMHCSTGVVELTDVFTLYPRTDIADRAPNSRGELLRHIRVLTGEASLRVSIQPREADQLSSCLRLHQSGPGVGVHLVTDRPLTDLHTTLPVQAGEDLWFLLRWSSDTHRLHANRLVDETAAAWRQWSRNITYTGPLADAVRRSALILKLVGHTEPSASASTASALRSIGLSADADHILCLSLGAIEDFRSLTDRQGEYLDCAFQWGQHGGPVDDAMWARLCALADAAKPTERADTYLTAMCHVALDRATRLHTILGLPGRPAWQAAVLRDRILREAWDENRQSLTKYLRPGGELDPRLLALPLRRVLPADHPRMVATTRAISERLAAGPGLVACGHHAHLPYSFWLADNLLGQSRIDEAGPQYEKLCAQADSLGLLPERLVPGTGEFAGQFPHPASHVAVISTGVALTGAGQ